MTRVLLVDDDSEIAELLAGQLRRAGYEVQCADSLHSAISVAAEFAPFDVLVTDFHLPDGDACDIANAVKLPVSIGLSGSSSKEEQQRLFSAGFKQVLVKPVTGKQLITELELHHLEGRP